MTLNDIRNDLEPEISLDDSSREFWVSQKNIDHKNTFNDVYQNLRKDIFLPWNDSLKISQKYRFFSRKSKHYFDPVFKSRFKKNIHLRKNRYFQFDFYKIKFQEHKYNFENRKVQEGFKNFYTKIPLNSTIQQKSHNFIRKELFNKKYSPINYYENNSSEGINFSENSHNNSIYNEQNEVNENNNSENFILKNKNNNQNIISDWETKNIFNRDFIKKYFSQKYFDYLNRLKNINLKNIFTNKNNYKKLWVVWLFLIFWMFWLKFSIQENVNNGYNKLIDLKNWELSGKTIEENFEEIYNSFKVADILYKPVSIIPNQTIDNGYHVIKWWKQIWYFWKYFLEFYQDLKIKAQSSGIENLYISDFLNNNRKSFYNFEKSLSQAILHYNQVTSVGDTKLQKVFDDTIAKLNQSIWLLKIVNVNFEDFLWLLWHYEQKDYLIVFQNNDEIRPTWGFMWSMWIISIYKWKVLEIKKSDVYAYEWEINKTYESIAQKTLAPEWLDKITGTWGLRDSNYYPEVKRSSHEIKWFLDRIDENIDGIIYINKSTIEEILKVSGWIEFDTIWEKLTDENFSRVISTLVEAKVSKVWTLGTPKQILFDFAETFYEKMKEDNDYIPYAKVIYNHLQSRDIMIYSFNTSQNSLLWKLWLNGELPFYKTLDFTYPVYTSISWNKSWRYIETEYEKNVYEFWECNYYTNFNIIRKHTYNQIEEEKVNNLLNKFEIADKEHIRYIQWKWDNYQYMRVLLPKYATVTPKQGMTVTQFPWYKEISFYMKTRIYETTHYQIEYYVNKKNCNGYSYKLFKQPWINNYNMSLELMGEKIFARDIKKDFFITR